MRKLFTVWMVAFYDRCSFVDVGMSDRFWSLCNVYTYTYRHKVRFVFHIQNHTHLNCSTLQTHFVSCYILQRQFGWPRLRFRHRLHILPFRYAVLCSQCALLCAHPYMCRHVLVNQQMKSRLCFLFVYLSASLSIVHSTKLFSRWFFSVSCWCCCLLQLWDWTYTRSKKITKKKHNDNAHYSYSEGRKKKAFVASRGALLLVCRYKQTLAFHLTSCINS